MIFLGCTIIGTYIIHGNFLGWTDALKKLSNIFYLQIYLKEQFVIFSNISYYLICLIQNRSH